MENYPAMKQTNDDTIELDESTANALAHHFGFQQWLSPNADSEYINEALTVMDAIVRFGECWHEQAGNTGSIAPDADVVVQLFGDKRLGWLDDCFEPEEVLAEADGLDLHPALQAGLELHFEHATEEASA